MNIQFGRLRPMYLHPAGQNLQRNRDRLWSFWVVSLENAAEKEKKKDILIRGISRVNIFVIARGVEVICRAFRRLVKSMICHRSRAYSSEESPKLRSPSSLEESDPFDELARS
jgi:hypothetical protein